MIDDLLAGISENPWSLVVMAALVLGDAFLVVIPGEVAVTALGALAVVHGAPPLLAVIAVAAIAALAGDALCYLIGRTIGLERWRWMRGRRVRGALHAVGERLRRRTAVVLFTARFVPFARLAVNLTAGASRVPAPRYLVVAGLAALGWAVYQSLVGAIVAAVVPGGPVVAVVVSVVVALLLGLVIDRLFARRALPTDR
ncbi:membrane protein DedA with SNARE-associated domain [Microbacterium sp. SLBN-154]|uniref:DedA family protein n=1 Tax=Microbacterium sp. SLBN-154 TaxID=2768458 RepID=UPI001150D6F9|nr:VTT domain-containing protein [Microbacterium sp. SLBN-154]TQK19205.1 membrane protein DedA with SNARE-associated domain [Microbacterium sp. SLBN-154]